MLVQIPHNWTPRINLSSISAHQTIVTLIAICTVRIYHKPHSQLVFLQQIISGREVCRKLVSPVSCISLHTHLFRRRITHAAKRLRGEELAENFLWRGRSHISISGWLLGFLPRSGRSHSPCLCPESGSHDWQFTTVRAFSSPGNHIFTAFHRLSPHSHQQLNSHIPRCISLPSSVSSSRSPSHHGRVPTSARFCLAALLGRRHPPGIP